jgi:hypothetical protein
MQKFEVAGKNPARFPKEMGFPKEVLLPCRYRFVLLRLTA